MLFKWLDVAEATKHADSVVEDIERLVPHAQFTGGDDARKKQMQKLDPTIEKHRRQCASARYNIYQKAKFANRVKWSLRDRGYPDSFVDSVIRLLII
jgi:hypothetical protein